MNEKLARLRKIVEEPSKREITMVYLDEESALQCVALPIDGDEPTTDEWIMLREEAEMESYRVFEVLSINNNIIVVPDGAIFSGVVPDDGTLLEALRLADGNREYYLSARR